MNNKSFANKAIITTTALAISFILLMGPTSMTMNTFATTNTANQGIGQSQASTQLGICISGDGTLFSCNNLSFQNQENKGNNAAAQSGGDDDNGGNSANQGIGQSQESEQSALCVSGEGTFLSCNNVNVQNQENKGNNALAQQSGSNGYNYNGGNSANQAIGQSQSSIQSSTVVSGDDSILSGNNVNVQNQENKGNNALAQQSGGNGNGDDYDHDKKDKKSNHNDDNDGNSSNQGISQSQDSDQSSTVVSGDDSVGSGNNVNVQNQENEGNNAAAQQD
jgi:hypothetical protein